MDDRVARLAASIGRRVKQERQARRWTLDQLAEAARVSRRMLVSVEQGATNPSVGTLLRISAALGVGLPSLVEPPEPGPVTLTRRGAGAALWHGGSGGRGVLVAAMQTPDILELWEWTLGPGDRHSSEPHAPRTVELLQVQDGTVAVDVAGETHTLTSGDALAFPGDVPHSYANAGPGTARFVLAVHEPAGSSRPQVSHA